MVDLSQKFTFKTVCAAVTPMIQSHMNTIRVYLHCKKDHFYTDAIKVTFVGENTFLICWPYAF